MTQVSSPLLQGRDDRAGLLGQCFPSDNASQANISNSVTLYTTIIKVF